MLNSINKKIFLSYIGLVLLVLFVVGISFTILLEDHIISTRSQDQITTGKELATLARGILTDPEQDHSELLFFLDRALETRVWVFNELGEIIKTSRPQTRVPRINPEEMEILLQGEILSQPPNNYYFNTLMLSTGIPIEKGGRIIGGIFLHYPISGIKSTISQIQINLLYAALFAVILTGGLSYLVSRGFSLPIRELDRSAREIAGGNFSRQVSVHRKDEIGTLGQSFNEMASHLQATLNQLSQERDKLTHTVSSIEEGVIALNNDGEIILSNSPAIKLFRPDKTPEDFAEKKVSELISSAETRLFLQQTLEKKEKRSELIELEENLTVFVQAFPIKDNFGKSIGIVSLLHNLKNLDSLEEIQQKFFAGVSHELKTPLTTIRSYAQALTDGTVGDLETRERFLKIICEEADNLAVLINDLLDYSRIKSGKIKPKNTNFSLKELVSKVIKSREKTLEEKKIETNFNPYPNGHFAFGDPALIYIVISNLLDNAIAFSPPDQKIDIIIEEDPDKYWVIVSDEGPGIPTKELPFIWEQFFRGERNGPQAKRGWGLGLATAREIVSAHGEQIKVENKKEGGAVFSFSLPKNKQQA